MARKAGIGRAEVEVLRFIADRGSATVTEVGDHLAATKGQTRNTALNMMERLRKKGYLEREKREGVFVYRPPVSRGKLFEGLIDDFVKTVLGGSLSPLAAYLTDRVDVDEAQLAELRRIVESLKEGEPRD